jgi:hypothetical protein
MEQKEIRQLTLEQLDQTFLKMHSSEWKLALEGKPKEIADKAKLCRLDVEEKRLKLRNAQLADILANLIENEEELEKGRQQVSETLNNLQQVEAVLDATSSFLGIIGRVISLP